MKRGKPLARKTGLKRGSGPKRKTALKARASKPLRQAKAKTLDAIAAAAWAKHARTKACAMCRRRGKGIVIRGHHVIYQQELERLAKRAGMDYERLRWDLRNLLPLCDGCHHRHHHGSRPVWRARLDEHAPKVWQFAREIDRNIGNGAEPATAFIERRYR